MTTSLSEQQKAVLRDILREAVRGGFDSGFDLEPIAQKHQLTVRDLYDSSLNTGLLWDVSQEGDGLIYVHHDGSFVSVAFETHELLAHWCDFHR